MTKIVTYVFISLFSFMALGQYQENIDVSKLTNKQKILLIQSLREFSRAFEKYHPVEKNGTTYLFLSPFSSAYAVVDEPCVIAGWLSKRSEANRCLRPETDLFSTNNSKCSSTQLACNPVLFGNNLCISFNTQSEKNSAFKSCEKKFDDEERSLDKIVEELPPGEFEKYVSQVKDVCINRANSQSKTGMCKSIISKFNEYIPGDHSGNMGRAQKAIYREDVAGIEKMLPKIVAELKEAQDGFLRQECSSVNRNDSSQYERYLQCEQLSRRIVKLNNLIGQSAATLDQLAKEEACQASAPKETEELASNAISITAKTDCSESEKKQHLQTCDKDIACLMLSTATTPFVMLTDYVGVSNNKCINSENSCFANIMSTAVRLLWSTIGGVWELIKAGWNKATELWTSMWGAEDKTSDAQNAIKDLSDKDKKEISQNPIEWVAGLMSNLWGATKDYLKNDVYCEKWSGSLPGQGTCVQPFRGFECMNCARILTSNCAAFGVIVGELLPTFLTGGLSAAAAKGAAGINSISKALRASKTMAKITKKLAPVLKPLGKVSAVSGKVASRVSKVTGTAARAASQKAQKLIGQIKNSKSMSAISSQATAFLANPFVRPAVVVANAVGTVVGKTASAVVEVEKVVFNAGRSTVEGIIGTSARPAAAAAAAGGTVSNAADSLASVPTKIEIKAESEITKVQKVEKQTQGKPVSNAADALASGSPKIEIKAESEITKVQKVKKQTQTLTINLPESNDQRFILVRRELNQGRIPESPFVSVEFANTRVSGKIIKVDKTAGAVHIELPDGSIDVVTGERIETIRASKTSKEFFQDKFENNPSTFKGSTGKRYKETNLKSQFEGEDEGKFFGTKVKYLNEEQRKIYEVFVRKDGRLVNYQGEIIDTRRSSSLHPGSGNAIFVMSPDGKIYLAHEHVKGIFHHSSFLSGGPVAAAGEVNVVDGVIKMVNRKSGHYQPGPSTVDSFLAELQGRGVQTNSVRIESGIN